MAVIEVETSNMGIPGTIVFSTAGACWDISGWPMWGIDLLSGGTKHEHAHLCAYITSSCMDVHTQTRQFWPSFICKSHIYFKKN